MLKAVVHTLVVSRDMLSLLHWGQRGVRCWSVHRHGGVSFVVLFSCHCNGASQGGCPGECLGVVVHHVW